MTELVFRPMIESDAEPAERLVRLAFGTWFGLAEPLQFAGDSRRFAPRLASYPDGGVIAEDESGTPAALGFASRWGSLGVLGPIAVRPDLWRHGIARQVMPALLDIFARWDCRLCGLFTFPQSATHLRLYQSFDFWPRHLTPILTKTLDTAPESGGTLSLAAASDRASLIAACRTLADRAFAGLDLSREIETVLAGRGDVLVLADGARLDGFAICHTGAGSEGGTKGLYVKFALVRPGDDAALRFERLVESCEALAVAHGVRIVTAGVPTGRHHAYRIMLARGYRTQLMGVMLHRPWSPAYDGPTTFALDDWR